MRRLLLLVSAITLADTMLYAALVPLLPHYAEEFGLGKAGSGLLVGAYAAGALLGALPAGLAAARFGPRRAVVAGLAGMALASVGFAFAGSVEFLGVMRLFQGIGSALSWAGGLAWLVAGTPRSRRGEMLGTAVGAAIFGALLGPALGAAGEHFGTRPVFLGVAGIAVLLAVWALETPGVDAEPQPLLTVLRVAREPVILGALWLMVLPALLFGVVAVLVPLDLARAGWGATGIAAVFVVSAAIEMVVAPLLGRFSDRRGRLLPVRAALIGAVVTTAAFALADRPAVIVGLVITGGIAFGGFWAPAMALLSQGAERIGLAQGLAFGLMNAAWGAGNSVGPSIGGALADAVGDSLPFAIMAALCTLTLLALARRTASGTRELRVPEGT
jgi:MFS family permease